MKLESMNESQAGEKIREQSEYIRQAESFARYAYEEWVRPEASERSLMMCCVDETVSDGTGVMVVCTGNRTLAAHAVNTMMESEDLSDVFARARRISEMKEDWLERIDQAKKEQRDNYIAVGICSLWTLLLIVMWAVAGVSLITTVSNLLLMGFVFYLQARRIMDCHRRVAKYKDADRKQKKELLADLKNKVKTLMEAVLSRREDDDDDEEDE